MKNNILIEATYSNLPECWIYKKGEYIYHGDGKSSLLPTIESKYKNILDELRIPSRLVDAKTEDGYYEYWDPDCYEEAQRSLPVYFQSEPMKYRFSGKYHHTDTFLTQETIDCARKMESEVSKKIREISKNSFYQDLYYEIFHDLLDGKKAVYEMYLKASERISFSKEDEKFEAFPIMVKGRNDEKIYTYTNVIFKVSEIKPNEIITLEVPEDKVGRVIGKGGWQVREWCKELNIKRINVVGIPRE